MHGSKTLAYIDEDGEDLSLCEAFAKTAVHHVNDASAGAELHEDEDLIRPVCHAMPCSVKEEDNVGVAFEDALGVACSCELQARYTDTHHDVDLLLDLREHSFVWDSDSLENMMGSVVDRLGGPHEIDMGEAAWKEVGLRWLGDVATTDLD